MTPIELRQLARQKGNEARAILAAAADRDVTEAEDAQVRGLNDEATRLEKRAAALERMDELDRQYRAIGAAGAQGGRVSDPLPHQDPANRRHSYSLLRALDQFCETKGRLDGLELETSQEIAKRMGRNPKGFFVPHDLSVQSRSNRGRAVEQRALDTTAAAGAIFETQVGSIAGLLRARALTTALGATFLTGLHGQLAIPKQTAGATFGWVSEGTGGSASNLTIGQVELRPATLTGYTEMTRSMMQQTSVDMEMFARQDLVDGIAIALDKAAFAGSGSGAEPTGLTTYSGITTVAIGTNGGPPTWQSVVDLESAVAIANADVGNLAYATNPKVRGKCKTTPKVSGYPVFLMEDGEVNGYSVGVSSLIPSTLTKGTSSGVCSALFFGDWSQLIMALWGGVDILPNPYAAADSGGLRIHIYQDADIEVRRTESFARTTDLTTT
jgi:HK97 family phage major capsid protein